MARLTRPVVVLQNPGFLSYGVLHAVIAQQREEAVSLVPSLHQLGLGIITKTGYIGSPNGTPLRLRFSAMGILWRRWCQLEKLSPIHTPQRAPIPVKPAREMRNGDAPGLCARSASRVARAMPLAYGLCPIQWGAPHRTAWQEGLQHRLPACSCQSKTGKAMAQITLHLLCPPVSSGAGQEIRKQGCARPDIASKGLAGGPLQKACAARPLTELISTDGGGPS